MLPQLIHIEQQFLDSGQKVCFESDELIANEGDACAFILYLPQHTLLKRNGQHWELKAGTYIHFKEYFMHQALQHTLITIQPTPAILFNTTIIERLKRSNHLFHLLFIQKLSKEATFIHAQFE